MTEPSMQDRVAAAGPVADAMLPPNATALERAILSAELARLSLVDPEVVRHLIDPWKCHAVLLPWLAAAFSVDIWRDEWSEEDKRAEIALSPALHRFKGTRWAVVSSLNRLGLPFDLIEWWETVPAGRRGTVRIVLRVGGTSGATEAQTMIDRARERIRATKPKSRVADILIGIDAAHAGCLVGTISIGGVIALNGRTDRAIALAAPASFAGAISVAGVVSISSTVH